MNCSNVCITVSLLKVISATSEKFCNTLQSVLTKKATFQLLVIPIPTKSTQIQSEVLLELAYIGTHIWKDLQHWQFLNVPFFHWGYFLTPGTLCYSAIIQGLLAKQNSESLGKKSNSSAIRASATATGEDKVLQKVIMVTISTGCPKQHVANPYYRPSK